MADTATMLSATPAPQPQAPLAVDTCRRVAAWRGRALDLSPTELDVLAYLHRHAGEAVAHDELLRAVWHATFAQGGSAAQVRSTVKRLRHKRDAATGGTCRIVSVRGVGYRLELQPAGQVTHRVRWPSRARRAFTTLGAILLCSLLVGGDLPRACFIPVWYQGRQVSMWFLRSARRGDQCAVGPGGRLYCFDTNEELAAATGMPLPNADPQVVERLRDSGAVPDLR